MKNNLERPSIIDHCIRPYFSSVFVFVSNVTKLQRNTIELSNKIGEKKDYFVFNNGKNLRGDTLENRCNSPQPNVTSVRADYFPSVIRYGFN